MIDNFNERYAVSQYQSHFPGMPSREAVPMRILAMPHLCHSLLRGNDTTVIPGLIARMRDRGKKTLAVASRVTNYVTCCGRT